MAKIRLDILAGLLARLAKNGFDRYGAASVGSAAMVVGYG